MPESFPDFLRDSLIADSERIFEETFGISAEQWRHDQTGKRMAKAFRALAEDGICPKCLRPLAEWPLTAPHSVAECRGSLDSAVTVNVGSGSPEPQKCSRGTVGCLHGEGRHALCVTAGVNVYESYGR